MNWDGTQRKQRRTDQRKQPQHNDSAASCRAGCQKDHEIQGNELLCGLGAAFIQQIGKKAKALCQPQPCVLLQPTASTLVKADCSQSKSLASIASAVAMRSQPDHTQGSPLLRIGEVSNQSGLPIKTIRFYCDEGLISATSRSEGGFRLFDQHVFDDLALIKTLKCLDTPLNQIRSLLQSRRSGYCHCNDLKGSLSRKLSSLDEQLDELERMRSSLQSLLDRWKDCGGTKPDSNG